jgi:apolipoprotein N-acyltransferase
MGDDRLRRATRVAIVQTNVPQSVRGQWDPAQRWADWLRMRELTLTAAVGGPDVIVWPETMFPGTAFDLPSVRAEQAAQLVWRLPGPDGRDVQIPAWAIRSELMTVQRELGVPMIVGAASFEQMRIVEDDKGLRYDWASRQNSAFLVNGGRVNEGWYSKLKLAPFGEVMPYISAWPWLEERLLDFGARGMRFDLEPGAGPLTLDIPTDGEPVRAATPICFEIAAAGVVRTLVFDGARRRADVLLTLTNDGWFGDWDGGREQHLQVARWRSVELGTGMARAANTGVSAIVDGRGRVLASGVDAKPGASRVDGVLTGDVPIYAGATPFATRVGLWPAWGLAVIAAAACVVPMKRRR